VPKELLDKPITLTDIVNRLCHLPELLRDRNEDSEAENLDCLIEEIKNEID